MKTDNISDNIFRMDVFEEFSNKESGKVVPSQKKDTTSVWENLSMSLIALK